MDILFFLGQLLALSGLGYGAWLCFLHAGKYGNPLDWKSADFPIPIKDLRALEELGRYGADDHWLSGNGVIDTQHQLLSDYVNNLRATILFGRPVDEVDAIIEAFIRDVVQHFQDEEAILVAANYPGTAKHAALHRELLNNATMLVGQFRAGASSIGELFRFLAHDILAKHMVGADREFILYAANQR